MRHLMFSAALAAFYNTNAGGKFFVCATAQPDDLTEAEFIALTWVEVTGIGNVGETGSSTNIVSYNTWDTDVTQKGKGVTDAGSPTVECARIADDAGQIILRAQALTNQNYAFKIERNDKPNSDVDSKPTRLFNRGLVAGPTNPNGRNEDFDLEVYTLALNQKQIIAEAVDGTI